MIRRFSASCSMCAVLPILLSTSPAALATGQELPDTVGVRLTTSAGDIELELEVLQAPVSTANFLQYVNDGFYNGTVFHRVLPDRIVQGGGLTDQLEKKSGLRDPIINESTNGLHNRRGTVAMSRFWGKPNSATAQFYVNVTDNEALDRPRDGAAYAVFGRVVKGMEVIDRINETPTGEKNGVADVPQELVVIQKSAALADADTVRRIIEYASTPAAGQSDPRRNLPRKRAYLDAFKVLDNLGVDGSKGVLTESGIWYVDENPGEGKELPRSGEASKLHIVGRLVNSKKFFSTRDKSKSEHRIIEGFAADFGVGVLELIRTMPKKCKRYAIVPPEMGYGEKGNAAYGVPDQAMLIYELQMLAVNKPIEIGGGAGSGTGGGGGGGGRKKKGFWGDDDEDEE